MARFPSSRAAGERSDLSVPKGAPVRGSLYDADAFGRFSEGLARFLGTGKYLFGQTLFVIVWIDAQQPSASSTTGTRTRSSCSTWPSPPRPRTRRR